MEDFYETGYSPLSPRGRNKKKTIKVIGIFVAVLVLLVIGLGILGATVGKKDQAISPTPTIPTEEILPTESPIPTETPAPEGEISPTPTKSAVKTPTPAPTKATPTPTKSGPTPTGAKPASLDRSTLSIEIQNGSGISGAAGQASALLKGLGYKVLSTGNADNYDYTKTIVKVKAEKKDYLNQLKLDLEVEYTIESATSDLTGSTADALVIVGKE